MKIIVAVIDAPSRSKGWARYAVRQNGKPIITTTTGNEWVGGTTKEADVDAGCVIEVVSQVQLAVGKGFRARKETTEEKFLLVVEEGVTDDLLHRPGSQGQRLRITGARRAAFTV